MKTTLERNVPDLDHVHDCFSQVQEQVNKIELYRDETETSLRSHVSELEKAFESTVGSIFYQLDTLKSSCKEVEEMFADVKMLHSETQVKMFEIESLNNQLSCQVTALRKSERLAHYFDSAASDFLEQSQSAVQRLELDLQAVLSGMIISSSETYFVQAAPSKSTKLKSMHQRLSEVKRICHDSESEIVKVACDCKKLARSLNIEFDLSGCDESFMSSSCSLQTTMDLQFEEIDRLLSWIEMILLPCLSSFLSKQSQDSIQVLDQKKPAGWDLNSDKVDFLHRGQVLISENEGPYRQIRADHHEKFILFQKLYDSSNFPDTSESICCDIGCQTQDLAIDMLSFPDREVPSNRICNALGENNVFFKEGTASDVDEIKKTLHHLKRSADLCRFESENEIKQLREKLAVAASTLDSEQMDKKRLLSETQVLERNIEGLNMECREFEIRLSAKDSEIEYLRNRIVEIEARALTSERKIHVLGSLEDEMVRIRAESMETMDKELLKFREKIKCLEDDLCEKLTIISDQQDIIDMKTKRIEEQEKTFLKHSEMLAVATHQMMVLEKSNAAYRAELSEKDLSRSGNEIFPNLRRQLMNDVEQLRQCAVSAQSLKSEICIPVFDQDLSLDPSILALRHALKPISQIISELMLGFTASKRLAAERTKELRNLEGEYEKLEEVLRTEISEMRGQNGSAHKSFWQSKSSENNTCFTPSLRQQPKETKNTLC